VANDKISLADFCAKAKKDVDKFYSMWIAAMAEHPGNYPANMNLGEWYGQFDAYMSSADADVG
jgi:hypothetical protein